MKRVALLIAVCVLAYAVAVSAATPKPVTRTASTAKPAARTTSTTAAADKDKKKSRVIKKVTKSPIKGSSPNPKIKKSTTKTAAKNTKVITKGNSGMGGAGKPVKGATSTAKATTTAGTKPGNKADQRVMGGKNKTPVRSNVRTARFVETANVVRKRVSAKQLAKQQLLAAGDAELEAAADAEALNEMYRTMQTGGPYKLSAKLTITQEQLDKVIATMPKFAEDTTFWHWDGFQPCTRWARLGLSQGEMDFFNSQSANMYAGGGLYMALTIESSAYYGMFPCRLVVRAGTYQYNDAVAAAIAKVLGRSLETEEKVALGAIVPFVHEYAAKASSRPPEADWRVTHNAGIFKSITGGNFKLGNGNMVTPHFTFKNPNLGREANIVSSLDLYQYWNTLMNVNTLAPPLEPDVAKADLTGGLDWLKRFTFLFSYIDGMSLLRALAVAPSDPWSVFAKDQFPWFQRAYEGKINARLAKDGTATVFGFSNNGVMGDGTGAAAWAKKMLDERLPALYKEISNGGMMAFRDEEVRAGGDEAGKTFISTTSQVAVMKQNPYLLVKDSPPRADGTVLVYYYYPDPLHLNPGLKPRVSAALWAAMEKNQAEAGTTPEAQAAYQKSNAGYKANTIALMKELILEAFTRVYGKSAEMEAGGLQIMLDLVGIHPCTDFNGRTTRFVGVVSALDSRLEPPIAFMSDFDIVTPFDTYGKFLRASTNEYLRLKKDMTGELLTGVCNGATPDHYHVNAWGDFSKNSLAVFSGGKDVNWDDSDWDMIRTRQFVAIMDKKFGRTGWKTRDK